MIKKTALYLNMLMLSVPLVAAAEVPWPQCAAISAQDDQALQAFYHPLNDQPQWLQAGQRERLAEALATLADDGLNPDDYRLGSTAPQALDCAELTHSLAYWHAMQHLYFGRLPQELLEPIWQREPWDKPAAEAQLLRWAQAFVQKPAQGFAKARPLSAQYAALRRVYAAEREQAYTAWPLVEPGALLKLGSRGARVTQLRERLIASGHLTAEPVAEAELFDQTLADAVRQVQREHALNPDALVGSGTLQALNLGPTQRRDQLRVNLERLRWLRHFFEPDLLLINVAAAELHLYRDGQPVWHTRTQVGRAERPTPLLKSRLSRLTLNPSWTIPPTILKKDKLPKIRADLAYLEQENLLVLDFDGKLLDPTSIDWARPGGIMLRQPPGPKNPLGHMALRFANPFSVYLHDTPSQNLFAKAPRTFSSGCVRIEAVDTLSSLLLSEAELTRVQELLAKGDTYEYRLAAGIPLLMAYWTVEVDGQGHVTRYPDSYGHDAKILQALLKSDAASRI